MKVPSPSLREHLEFVATVLATFAVVQYTGVFSGNPGEIDPTYLVRLGLLLPITAYLLTAILANVEWLPQWNKMVRNEE
ncbi:hypothetical protein [Natrinema longum]|uniref:Uncharacterized protein n=1 Tax=Natrinema longum TaxID=370324 RepID=A0A8A2UA32_9EURY|nr:hypothetical protein [Natrinema longum]MBZ6496550.1 hypothetical protein [Natrinema longum]QSW85546.1 hypothetical protein J0X27_01505 [Natrinema longum]